MSEETDRLIEIKEAEFLLLRSRMEELKEEFAKQTVDFAFKWYRKTTTEYIAKNPEITLKMSEEKIAKMKAAVNDLVENTEKIVRGEFDDAALWWHLNPRLNESIDKYKQVADMYPEALDRAVRRVLGHLGIVLEEFGFNVTARGFTGAYKEFWFEHSIDGKETVPCYPHLLSWTQEMQSTIRKYDARFTQATALYGQIQQLKEEKKRQEALAKWDTT